MKTTTKIMLATVMAAGFTLANTVTAGEASPRGKDNQITAASAGTAIAENNAGRMECCSPTARTGSPRGNEQAASLRKVAGTTKDNIDHSFVAASPKMREVFGDKKFQVAPVK